MTVPVNNVSLLDLQNEFGDGGLFRFLNTMLEDPM